MRRPPMATRRGGQRPARMPARKRLRFPAYDYSQPGAYFITICTEGRHPILRDPLVSEVVREAWHWLPHRFPNIRLDEFVVMPDHVHFIVWLLDEETEGGQPPAPTILAPKDHRALGNVVGAFKTVAARNINALRNSLGQPVWQRNYFERVIRDEDELCQIRQYIQDNPLTDHAHESPSQLREAWERKTVGAGSGPPACL